MIGRAFLTSLYASTMVSSLCFMIYAMAIVADRETPAWQCTSTLAPLFRASSETKQVQRRS
jgi:TM2 domain-containing membrane protein YozV